MANAELIKTECKMPDVRYANLWDSIIVDRSIKDRLLRSAALSLRLRAELPFETTALHGLAFLYGPPVLERQLWRGALPTNWHPLRLDDQLDSLKSTRTA